jgi:hypothetical protein
MAREGSLVAREYGEHTSPSSYACSGEVLSIFTAVRIARDDRGNLRVRRPAELTMAKHGIQTGISHVPW